MLPCETLIKLGKFIPLLSSDKDGEVVAAARAIGRALDAGGADFHTLTAMVTGRASAEAKSESAAMRAGFNYADEYRRAQEVGGNPTHADAPSPRFGLQIDGSGWLASWRQVSEHCLKLNREVHRKHGGRFLRDFEKLLLERFRSQSHWPTNAQAAWIETVLARCHQARDAAARADR